jgi:hypothetical protein
MLSEVGIIATCDSSWITTPQLSFSDPYYEPAIGQNDLILSWLMSRSALVSIYAQKGGETNLHTTR